MAECEKKNQFSERLEEIFEFVKKAANEKEGWEERANKEGVMVYSMKDPDVPLDKVKATGLVRASLDEIYFLLLDREIYMKVDKNAKEFRTLRKIDEDTMVNYSRYRGYYTVADRDFVYVVGKKLEPNTSLLYASTSVPFESEETADEKKKESEFHVACPKGVVRGYVYYSGWYIVPVEEPSESEKKAAGYGSKKGGKGEGEKECWCKVCYSGQLDLRGWIPTRILNMAAGAITSVITSMRGNMPLVREEMASRSAVMT
mmetsp:Transcript_18683/g.52556  ORF Transcript_18683/g.52556 Transcript_18683/m.52556 type:complete len:259 (+) Transcript_18683:138-914(+)